MLGTFPNFKLPFMVAAVSLLLFSNAVAQTAESQEQRGPTVIAPARSYESLGLGQTNLQCVGYFRMPGLKDLPRIVGGEQEQEKTIYASGDFVYIDAGHQRGIREGQEFHIIRPRGEPARVFRQKKGYLGVYVQEVGELRVIRVKESFSVAQVTYSCDTALLGDFLTGVPDRSAPELSWGRSLDRFAEPSSKPIGRVLMSREGKELVAVGDIIYVDLGVEDSLKQGDSLTIYRKLGTGNLNIKVYDQAVQSREGYASEHYRGGGLSNQALRSREMKGEEDIFRHGAISSSEVKSSRPSMPRKIIGEAKILNVQTRTATAIITSVSQEVHTGDFVELR
jgi:hypothetical protein